MLMRAEIMGDRLSGMDYEKLQLKASYCDTILKSDGLITTTAIAKDYGTSAMAFNKMLHSMGVQYKQGDIWYLYAKYQGCGYMQGKTHSYPGSEGRQHAKAHSYWTQKGRMFLYDFLKRRNILPLSEREQW